MRQADRPEVHKVPQRERPAGGGKNEVQRQGPGADPHRRGFSVRLQRRLTRGEAHFLSGSGQLPDANLG
ncbi:MAG: hypothetical protein ACK56F_05055, partial [bacterium]